LACTNTSGRNATCCRWRLERHCSEELGGEFDDDDDEEAADGLSASRKLSSVFGTTTGLPDSRAFETMRAKASSVVSARLTVADASWFEVD
jgi:hypothetical protein